jgi:hypothetical protein
MRQGVYFTGGSLNPARSLGPAVIGHSFPGYFWIYWVGPLLGSLLACGFYVLLKYLRWQDCNPGQDWYAPNEKAQTCTITLKNADADRFTGTTSRKWSQRSGSFPLKEISLPALIIQWQPRPNLPAHRPSLRLPPLPKRHPWM